MGGGVSIPIPTFIKDPSKGDTVTSRKVPSGGENAPPSDSNNSKGQFSFLTSDSRQSSSMSVNAASTSNEGSSTGRRGSFERRRGSLEDLAKAGLLAEPGSRRNSLTDFLAKSFNLTQVVPIKPNFLAVPSYQGHPFVRYRFLKKVGQGGFSVVYKAVSDDPDQEIVAVKEVNASRMTKQQLVDLQNEINILSQLDHISIVKIFSVFSIPDKVYIVMSYLKGGELLSAISKREAYIEKDASRLISQIASALEYLHERRVVHRDLKPDNLILESKSFYSRVLLVDFGFALVLTDKNDGKPSRHLCGTPGYMAPEVIKDMAYSTAVDMWALGVVSYILLSGYMPFGSKQENTILSGSYNFKGNSWKNVSNEAKAIISELLVVQPKNRLTAKELLSRQWVNAHTSLKSGSESSESDSFIQSATGEGSSINDTSNPNLSVNLREIRSLEAHKRFRQAITKVSAGVKFMNAGKELNCRRNSEDPSVLSSYVSRIEYISPHLTVGKSELDKHQLTTSDTIVGANIKTNLNPRADDTINTNRATATATATASNVTEQHSSPVRNPPIVAPIQLPSLKIDNGPPSSRGARTRLLSSDSIDENIETRQSARNSDDDEDSGIISRADEKEVNYRNSEDMINKNDSSPREDSDDIGSTTSQEKSSFGNSTGNLLLNTYGNKASESKNVTDEAINNPKSDRRRSNSVTYISKMQPIIQRERFTEDSDEEAEALRKIKRMGSNMEIQGPSLSLVSSYGLGSNDLAVNYSKTKVGGTNEASCALNVDANPYLHLNSSETHTNTYANTNTNSDS